MEAHLAQTCWRGHWDSHVFPSSLGVAFEKQSSYEMYEAPKQEFYLLDGLTGVKQAFGCLFLSIA